MKKNLLFIAIVLCMMASFSASAQKYKSASDTVKLNKEYVEVSNEVAELTAKLTIAQNNLPGFNSKVGETVNNAQTTAQQSSDQAAKATNGDLDDAQSAKKKAKKAADDAEDAQKAKDKAIDQQKKIDKLTSELEKKQKKLQELDGMRTTIRNMHQ